jgi:hypothetical protein
LYINQKRVPCQTQGTFFDEPFINEKGYQEEEIHSIKGGYDWMKGVSYHGTVIFTDEPEKKHYYTYQDEKTIYQFGMSGSGKHVEEGKTPPIKN